MAKVRFLIFAFGLRALSNLGLVRLLYVLLLGLLFKGNIYISALREDSSGYGSRTERGCLVDSFYDLGGGYFFRLAVNDRKLPEELRGYVVHAEGLRLESF